ncbi:unnamed protein product [Closterium sp. NIES-53]
MSKVLIAEGLGYKLLSASQLMAKGIHLGADSTAQEFKLYHGKGGLYIGKAVLKNNVFVLDFVLDLGTADSDGIVTFTSWTHPPDLDPDFSPEGFWYSHTIPEAERTRALVTIQHSAAAETTSAAAETTSGAAETTSAAAETTSGAAETTLAVVGTTIVAATTTPVLVDEAPPTPAQQLKPVQREVHRSANFTASFYSNSDAYQRSLGHSASEDIWHTRMGHPSNTVLNNTIRGGVLDKDSLLLLDGRELQRARGTCLTCLEADLPHRPFTPHHNPSAPAYAPLEKETVAARDVIFYERLTLQTYLANLQEDQDPTGGFRGDRAFVSAADEADWDEQNVANASKEAGPLPFCSVNVPMDEDNPRESLNAETFYYFADNGYVTPATVNTNKAERVGPNFIPDPEARDEAAYPEDATLPRYSQTGLQILGLVTAVHGNTLPKEPPTVQQALGGEHREKWREAMDIELKALEERNTWKVVPISVARNKTILTEKWVFRVKTKADGTIEKFKARWVVRGFDQEHGRDFTETFAPYLHARLIRIGFRQLPHDQGMYRLTKDTDYIVLIVYVDDLLYIGSNDDITTWFEGELQRDLTLTVSSTVTQYLGLNIREEEGAIYINAAKYADTIAKRFALTPTTISTPYRYVTRNHKEGSSLLKSDTRLPEKAGLPSLRSRHLPPRSILLRKPARHLPQEA